MRAFFEGMTPFEAAEQVARPPRALVPLLPSDRATRARLVIDVFEARAASAERRERGVFYTPPEIVEAMLGRAETAEHLLHGGNVLDPSSGAGAFVLALARRMGAAALERIWACDLDSSALDACALALSVEFPTESKRVEHWRKSNAWTLDFLRDRPAWPAPNLVIGNPPYRVTSDAELAERFPELGGQIDLYACFVLQALRQRAAEGTVALLIPDTWLTNRRAGAFRAHIADVGVRRIVDFGKPFASARDTRVLGLFVGKRDSVCAVESRRDGELLRMADAPLTTLETRAERGWFLYRTSEEVQACKTLERNGTPLAERFDVIYGLRTGANALHLGVGAGSIPIVGGRDLEAYDRRPASRHLIEPRAFEARLAGQRGRAKLGVQRIRTNSRLSWRRWLEAAPLEANEIGLDSLTLLARKGSDETLDDDMCCLLGALSSSFLNRWYRLSFTDVNIKPAYLATLPVPPPSPELARLVRMRLRRPRDLRLERSIDRLVARDWRLDATTIETLEQGYWGEERRKRPLPSLQEALAFLEPL